MSILDILNELAADNSRLAKEAILKREVANPILRDVMRAAYDPMINYWQVKIPSFKPVKQSFTTLGAGLQKLKSMISREVTGNDAISYFSLVLSELTADDAEVMIRVVQRDLRCGVSEATINKIWPGLIPTFDVMLAHKDTSGIKYPAYAQVKSDGMRCHLYFDGSSCIAYTRNGKTIDLKNALDESARVLMKEGEVWDGEIIFMDNGKVLDRKTGNGLGNKGVKGTITEADASKARFIVWDIVDFSSTIPYDSRLFTLNLRFNNAFQKQADIKILAAETVVVKSQDEALAYYAKCIAAGEEGAMLKNIKSVWQGKRTKDLGKMKSEEEADLIVVGWEIGTGKNAGRLGALVCETQDHKLRVNVGTGFSDKERDELTPDVILEKIITVRYNQIIQDKNSGVYSLFLPRFIEIRNDKSVANNFGDLK
jgi:ATP-dependent DNA ligase